MNKNRVLYFISVFVIMIVMLALTDNYVLSGLVTIGICVPSYLIVGYRRALKRISLIDDMCDPYAFVEATEKQWEITGKNKNIDAYLSIDRSAGYILMGEYNDAIIELEHIDKNRIMKRTAIKLVYHVNLASALYSIGEIERADDICQNVIEAITVKNKRYIESVKYLYLLMNLEKKNFDEAKILIEELKKEKSTNRRKAYLAYSEGLIYLEEKSRSKALARFRDVVKYGNKLHIVKLSKEHIASLESCID